MERYDYQASGEARLIRLQTELERKLHEAQMRVDRRIHDLEMQIIRLPHVERPVVGKQDPFLEAAPYVMILTTAIVIGLALSK